MKRDKKRVKSEQCAYKNCCYLAEALDCYGYTSDCTLYLKSNGQFCSSRAFDLAVNKLIDKTKAKHELLTNSNPK